jgi:dipeptidase
MCDTIVALKNSTLNGSVLFGKNSDREKDEPHIIVRVPRKEHKKGEKVRCTYIEVDQVELTYDCILCKPSWIWGAEMGVNENGVVIGNEAVFTREKQGPPALLGMDILRLSLERSRTAREAVDNIIYLIEHYGQGGKCGYTKDLRYHNSFLIADFNYAWVLETAGSYWAVEEVKDIRSISNALSIREFKERYENKLITMFSCGDFRQHLTTDMLKKKQGRLAIEDFKNILRHHHNLQSKNILYGSMKNICMHSKSIISSETTGSLIVELIDNRINIFATGSSLPCLSIYKPLWFLENLELFYNEEDIEPAIDYWRKQRKVIEEVETGRRDRVTYLEDRDRLEKGFLELARSARDDTEREDIIKKAWKGV